MQTPPPPTPLPHPQQQKEKKHIFCSNFKLPVLASLSADAGRHVTTYSPSFPMPPNSPTIRPHTLAKSKSLNRFSLHQTPLVCALLEKHSCYFFNYLRN